MPNSSNSESVSQNVANNGASRPYEQHVWGPTGAANRPSFGMSFRIASQSKGMVFWQIGSSAREELTGFCQVGIHTYMYARAPYTENTRIDHYSPARAMAPRCAGRCGADLPKITLGP